MYKLGTSLSMLDYEEFDNMVGCIMVTALLECFELQDKEEITFEVLKVVYVW